MTPEIAATVAEFVRDRKSGTVLLEIKNGTIVGWKVTVSHRANRKTIDTRAIEAA